MPKPRANSLFLESGQDSVLFSFPPQGELFFEWKSRIETFLAEESRNTKLADNYNLNDFKWDEHRLITLETSGEQILTFATALERQRYFPRSSVRICNRFLKSSRIKRFWGRSARQRTVAFINEQIRALISMDSGYNYFFISRQPPSGFRFMEHLTADVLNKHCEFAPWRLIQDLCLVCGEPDSVSCWQIVTGFNLVGDEVIFPMRMSKDEWHTKFAVKK